MCPSNKIFDWRKLIDICEFLKGEDHGLNREACFRTVLNRMYMAVRNIVRNSMGIDFKAYETIQDMKNIGEKIQALDPNKKITEHVYIEEKIREKDDDLASYFSDLRKYRNWADYYNDIHEVMRGRNLTISLDKLCDFSFYFCDEILDNLDKLGA